MTRPPARLASTPGRGLRRGTISGRDHAIAGPFLSIINDLLHANFAAKLSSVIEYGRSFRETLSAIGERARQLRLLRKLRQDELAARAGIGVATVHRFEKTGTASIENVLRIATALNAEATFDRLFEAPPYQSLEEALERPKASTRRRAPRRK